MASQTVPVPVEKPVIDSDMTHLVCWCSQDVGLCGTDVAAAEFTSDDEDCVVCAAMRDVPCPRCGEWNWW